ncbi:MAG: hypothetical protein HYZ84_06255 [Candidatus Omnitrophica bacterium]|nr:hypothetical protein [Candidatus Omnitrophota bacterium]
MKSLQTNTLDFEITFFERLIKEKPDYLEALIPLAAAYTRKGLYEKGLGVDKTLARLCKKDPVVHYNLACSLALVGQKKQAIQVLKTAIELGYRDFEHLKKDPDLQSLCEDPEFQNLKAGKRQKSSSNE